LTMQQGGVARGERGVGGTGIEKIQANRRPEKTYMSGEDVFAVAAEEGTEERLGRSR